LLYLLAPLCAVVGLAALVIVGPIAASFLIATGAWRHLRFRRALWRQGRFVAREDLERRLAAGEGTVIEEIGLKGPTRLWWTPDDVPSLGTLPLSYRDVVTVLEGGEHAFNAWCLTEYLDVDRGRAVTVSFSPRAVRRGDLARRFARSRWVKVVRPVLSAAPGEPPRE